MMNIDQINHSRYADSRLRPSHVRGLDRYTPQQLLQMIGRAVKEDYQTLPLADYLPPLEKSDEEWALAWLHHNAVPLVRQLYVLGIISKRLPLTLQTRDFAGCVRAMEEAPWVHAPIATSIYMLKFGLQCRALGPRLRWLARALYEDAPLR